MLQFLIFVLVGVVNTGFDFVVWRLFVRILKSKNPIVDKLLSLVGIDLTKSHQRWNEFAIAQFFSYTFAVVLSYTLNSIFTFKASGNMIGFLIVNLINLFVSTSLINILTKSPKIKAIFDQFPTISKHQHSIIKIGIVFFTMVVSFVGYKYFVYCDNVTVKCLIGGS